jgi:diacylglycerol kinase family enzyme
VPRAVLIVNPFASRVTDDRVERVVAVLGDVDIHTTECPGHATELARDADGHVEAIYVFSGDGGFNEVLNGVRGQTPLGFIPGGGASVLPRALGLPRDPVAAARRLLVGSTRRISLGRVNDRRFGFSAGVGFDAELVRRVDARGRTQEGGRAGNVAFAAEALRLLAASRFRLDPVLEVRGHGRTAFALAANGDPYTYAGRLPLRVAPFARFEGGLDLVGARAMRPASLLRFLAYVVRGAGQERARDVLYAHDVDRVEIVCDRPLPLQADGEDLGDVTDALLEAERDAITALV